MEQQAATVSTPPPTLPVEVPPVPTPPARPQTPLSNPEPFLRFPRPQGNRRLASWISASDPDLMHSIMALPEEPCLAESTFELVTSTDSESQDGNYTESMAGSVSSFDPHPPDDIQSLDGAEFSYDGESVADDVDFPPLVSQLDLDREADALLVAHKQHLDPSDLIHYEKCSQSSLEYTHHSLGAPSISTPEASRLTERPSSPKLTEHCPDVNPANGRSPWWKRLARLWDLGIGIKEHAVHIARMALPGLLFAATLSLLVPVFYDAPAEKGKPQPCTVVSTVTTNTTSFVVSTTKKTLLRPSSTGGMGLIPLDDDTSDEWLFSARKPVVSFTPHAPSDVLIHVADDVKRSWLEQECVTVAALREDRRVETTMSPVGQGILLKFPRKEAYGVVKLALSAACRPKVQRVVKVHFGKGAMEEVMEITRNLFAHNLTSLMPVVAQEAERCLAGARRSLGAMSESVGNGVIFVSDNLANRLSLAVAAARRSAGVAKLDAAGLVKDATEGVAEKLNAASRQVTKQLLRVQRFQTILRLTLLDAQISANIWWLEATGRKAEHDDYQRKAIDFVAKQRAAAKEALQAGKYQDKAAEKKHLRLWSRLRRRCRGQESPPRGESSSQEAC